MSERALWRIGAEALTDNYRAPDSVGEVVWRAGEGGQRWPLFHASEADPEGGYRPHPYTIEFQLEGELAPAYRLHLRTLTIAPRLAHMELNLNGVSGRAYLRPRPATGEIQLHAGLHAAIYSEGEAEVILPRTLLRLGPNTLTLTARDGSPFTVIANAEKIKRLDRMATGAGFIYQHLELMALAAPPTELARVAVQPTVIFRRNTNGQLVERCDLFLELAGPIAATSLNLQVCGDGRSVEFPITLPACAFGHVRETFDLFDGDEPVTYRLCGELNGRRFEQGGEFRRRRKWQIFVAPHAHTDIGYTHRQWEVAERLARNLDFALDRMSAEADFAYHLDAAWVLEHYALTRDAGRLAQLREHIRAGRLGVPANYAITLSQFAALEDSIRNFEFGDNLEQGVLSGPQSKEPPGPPPKFAAVVDVPSLSGSVPALLDGAGVRYLVHAANQDRGPLRAIGGLHRRSPFYWHGPTGGRVLVWLAKMYCELRKVCGSPPDVYAAERGLGLWLDEFERDDYAPDKVLLYGQEADNTDLDPQPADFIREWNATFEYPRLISCAVTEFFEQVENEFGAVLATVAGDGGAYWEDGAGSTLAATIDARRAQAALPAAERLESLAVLHHAGAAYPESNFTAAWRQLLLFDEHTWGAFLSATDPDSVLQRDQWRVKEGFARDAMLWAERLLHVAATRHSLSWNTLGREVAVYNPHNWPLSGAVRVEAARGEELFELATGEPLPARRVRELNTQAWVEFWAEVPGLSYRRFGLRPASRTINAGVPAARSQTEFVLENDHYRLTVDARRGCATGWFDRALNRELVDTNDAWGFGQFVYASGGEGSRLTSNQAGLPEGDLRLDGSFECVEAESTRDALAARVRVVGRVAGGRLEIEWSLPHNARRVEVQFVYHKTETLDLEAAYIAFPFQMPGANVFSDSQLGWVNWNADRLPGACVEWLPLQTAVLVQSPEVAVCLASPDVPLFCVGEVVRGRWPASADLSGGRLFSYVLNNYWRTNYKASQGGELRFGYQLTSERMLSWEAAFRFGWAARRPLYAQRLSLQEFREPSPPYAEASGGCLARVGPEQIHLSTLKPAREGGWIARLQEIGGAARTARLAFPGHRITHAWLTDLLERDERPIEVAPDGSLTVEVPAWGLATVRFELTPC